MGKKVAEQSQKRKHDVEGPFGLALALRHQAVEREEMIRLELDEHT